MKMLATSLLLALLTSAAMAAETQGDVREESWQAGLLGETLVDAAGTRHDSADLQGKQVGLYFSAHWCPPCRGFTPKLVEFYNGIRKKHDDFEIVFVSSDRDEGAMRSYMNSAKMPWLAVPYDRDRNSALGGKYGVRGIPTLVILDKHGHTVTRTARMDVAVEGLDAYGKWQSDKSAE